MFPTPTWFYHSTRFFSTEGNLTTAKDKTFNKNTNGLSPRFNIPVTAISDGPISSLNG